MAGSSSTAPPPDAPSSPDAPAPDAPTQVSWRHVVASVLLSLLALALVGYFTFDPEAFRETLRYARLWMLVGAVVMALARIGIGGWRLTYVSQGRLDLAGGMRGQLAWYFFANVTPTLIGGAPVATFYVAHDEDLPVGETAAFMFFCMLLNWFWFLATIPVLIGAGFVVELLPSVAGTWGWQALVAYFGVLFVWGTGLTYFMLVRPRHLAALVDWVFQLPLLRRFRDRGMREMRSYYRSAKRLGEQPASFYGWGFIQTALLWLSRYAVVFFIVRSLHVADAGLLFLRSAATLLVALVLPTPGGSGGLEGLYALFIGPLMPEALMAPTLLLWRLLDYYLFIALGTYLFLNLVQTGSAQGPSTDAN
ncbi:MAG: lysylphosphatidylglycerol synthase transmembrane domain-containing protein [Salinibacter sp.]